MKKRYILQGWLGVTEFWYGLCFGLMFVLVGLLLGMSVGKFTTNKDESILRVEVSRNASPGLQQHPEYYVGYAEGYVDGIDYQKRNK